MANHAIVVPNNAEPDTTIIFVNLSQCKTLTSTNYAQWSFQIRSFLEGLDLYQFLDGTHPCPAAPRNGLSRSAGEGWFEQAGGCRSGCANWARLMTELCESGGVGAAAMVTEVDNVWAQLNLTES